MLGRLVRLHERGVVADSAVAGNVADLAPTVIAAAGQGTMAGAMINADLVAEDTRRAVAAVAAWRAHLRTCRLVSAGYPLAGSSSQLNP